MYSRKFIRTFPKKFEGSSRAILKNRESYLGEDAPEIGSSVSKELEIL